MTTSGRSPLLQDVRRMAPIWGIVLATATCTLLGVRYFGAGFLLRSEYKTMDGCRIAEVLREGGRRAMEGLRRRVGEMQLSRQGKPATGLLKGDAGTGPAREQLERAARLCPDMPGIHGLLAELSLWEGDEGQTYLEQGLEALAQRDDAGARINLEQSLRISPGTSRAIGELGSVYIRTSHLDLAESLLKASPAEALESGPGLAFQARLAGQAGDLARALEAGLRSLAAEPGQTRLYPLMGAWYQQAGRAGEGAEALERQYKNSTTDNPEPHHAIAILFEVSGKLEKALVALDRAIRLAPTNASLFLMRSEILDKLGKTNEAREAYQDALERDPEYVRSHRKAS